MISALPITPERAGPRRSTWRRPSGLARRRGARFPTFLCARAVCTSSTTKTMPCSSQISRTPWTNSVGARRTLPSPRIGSITIAATLSAATCVTKARRSALSADSTSIPGTRADTGRGRPPARTAEPRLVRMRLRRHRHREQRAAVERAFEGDHGRPLRVRAGELDRVLDRLGAGVEERGLRRRPGSASLDQALGELDVASYGMIVVGVRSARAAPAPPRLPGMRVADVEAADAAGEVDERVAVDVGEGRARSRRRRSGGRARAAPRRRAPCARRSRERGPGSSVRSRSTW